MNAGIEIKFVIRFRENVRANVATFHHEIAELNALALFLLHPIANFRSRGHMRNRRARFRRANFFLRKIAFHQQMNRAQIVFDRDAFKRRFPFATRGGDCFFIVNIDAVFQAIPGERAIHGAGIDVNVAERFGDEPRVGAFAAGAGAVDGDDNR